MKYFLIIVVALQAGVLGIEIPEFSCEFKENLCDWEIKNLLSDSVQWKLTSNLTLEDEANIDLPNDVKDKKCLLAYSKTNREGILESLLTNVTSTNFPKFLQFQFFLNTGAELVIHLAAKMNHLIFDSGKDNETVYGQWKTLQLDTGSILNIPEGQYRMTIEANINNTWFALRHFTTQTTDDSFSSDGTESTEQTTTDDSFKSDGTESTEKATTDDSFSSDGTESTEQTTTDDSFSSDGTESTEQTTTVTSYSKFNETTNFQGDNSTLQTNTEYPNSQSDELKGFEKLLRDLGWKKVLAILVSVFFGSVIIASIVKFCQFRSKIVPDDEEEILFDGLETVSSFHKHHYNN